MLFSKIFLAFYGVLIRRQPATNSQGRFFCRAGVVFVSLFAACVCVPTARCDLSLNLDLYKSFDPSTGQTNWYTWANLNTTNTPVTYYQLSSPHSSILDGLGNGGTTSTAYFNDFGSMLNEITNGNWTLILNVGDPSQTTYTFNVSASGISSDTFPNFQITNPTYGEFVPGTNVDYTWTGPASWASLNVNLYDGNGNFYESSSLPAGSTSWDGNSPLEVSLLDYTFNVDYSTDGGAYLTCSTPMTSVSRPLADWTEVTTLHLDENMNFGIHYVSDTGHSLIAHYTFDNSGFLGQDSAGYGNDMYGASWWGTQQQFSSDAKAGAGAVQFFGTSSLTPDGSVLNNWDAVLAGSFTISAWMKTTASRGNNTDDAINGNTLFWAYNDHNNTNDTIPLSLTGSKEAFTTRNHLGNVTTVHSVTSINDGNYHLVTVTRDLSSGLQSVYVDGNLEGTATGTTEPLNGNNYYLSLGGTTMSSYTGLVDDVQIYTGVLSAGEVSYLFNHPGSPVADSVGPTSSTADFSQYLVARYDFEDTNSPGLDSSGNNNNANCGGGTGGQVDVPSTNAAVGNYARQYFGNTFICFPPGSPAYPALSNAISGDFTVTAWVNTTNTVNSDYANAYYGAPIWFEYSSDINQAIVSITGSKAAFTVGNPNGGSDTTLHSTATLTDGQYHLIAATRSQTNGSMSLYVDGVLQATAISTNGFRPATGWMYLAGGLSYPFFTGLLDDVRIYSAALSADEVASLSGQVSFGTALGAPGLAWTTSGDTSWLTETTNTYAGSSAAAQSGSVTGSQSSTLSVTVTGPGTLTFYWSSIANDPNQGFDCEFDIDGNDTDDLYGDTSWYQDGPFSITAGQHTLTWTAYAYGDTDPTEAAYLDSVSFVPTALVTPPVITLNPFDQTNYPGYQAALLASATSSAAITWQWYEVGSASPIVNATNSLYIPANSGTSSVAGQYYAIVTNSAGSATTTVATVSFQTAVLPPNWSAAFKSPFFNNNYPANEGYISCYQDSSSNLYAVGFFYGTNSIGSTNYISPNGTYSAEIVKQTAAGNAIWAVAITNNGSGDSQAYGVVPAPNNGIYVAGNFNGTNWLGTNQLADLSQGTYKNSIFLARLDANGNPLWVRTISGTNFCFTEYYELVSDPAGNVTLSGLFSGSTLFSSTNLATSTNLVFNGQQGGLAQYDPNGALRWAENTTNWLDIMTYNNGRIYGTFGNNATNFYFGDTHVQTDRANSVAAINEATGQPIWVQGVGAPFGSSNPFNLVNIAPAVAVSGTNVFVAGTAIASNAAFGSYNVSWPDYARQYLARCDTNGTPQSLTAFGSDSTMIWSILAAANGGVYVSGDFDNYSIFGNDIIAAPVLSSIGDGYFSDGFLAKFDENGNPLWARIAVPQADLVNLRGLASAPDGVWACGIIDSPTSFGSILVSSSISCIGSPFCTIVPSWSGVLAKITDAASSGSPVTLSSPQSVGGNFEFSFLSQSGSVHVVKYTTNLLAPSANWLTYTNIAGDGTVKTVPIPLSVFAPSQEGFVRVLTQ